MKKNNKENSLFSGVVWTYAERIAAQGVSAIVTVILARILLPEHYGAVAIALIVLTFCDIFVTDSISNALIQKKDSDSLDFSSVFYSTLVLSLILYGAVFFAAPSIAAYYETPELTGILRVLCLRIPISSLNAIQHAYVSKHMQFRKFFFSTLIGTIISAGVGITMAKLGFGAWALVAQYLTNTVIDTIVLMITVEWRPKLEFSFSRLVPLYRYGWKLLVSALLSKGFSEVRDLIIGKQYSTTDLAFYNKGKQFPALAVTSYNTAIGKVLFAAIAREQDRIEDVKNTVKRTIQLNIYILSPILLGLAVVAEPFVRLILTEKWLFCVDYLRCFCIIYLLSPIQTINLNAIRAIGRSDITLKLEIAKKIVDILGLLAALFIFKSVLAIVIAQLVTALINTVLQVIPCGKLISYGFLAQLKDYTPSLLCGLVMCGAVYALSLLPISPVPLLIVQVLAGAGLYFGMTWLFKFPQIQYLWSYLRKLKK